MMTSGGGEFDESTTTTIIGQNVIKRRSMKSNCSQFSQRKVKELFVTMSSHRNQSLLIATLLLLSLFTSSQPATASQQQQQLIDEFLEQNFAQTSKALPLSQEGAQFNALSYKNVYEAIRAHPDLREFGALCETRGVKEIVAMDKTPLTVFAPIDRSLGDLLWRVRQSPKSTINLVELAKQHIAQGLVMQNDESAKYPMRISSYAQLSPLYVNNHQASNGRQDFYVNNARIVATYLFEVDQEQGNYQALHLIDQALDYAYLNKNKQLRAPPALVSGNGGAQMSAVVNSGSANIKLSRRSKVALSSDDLLQTGTAERAQDELAGALMDFSERFGELRTNLAQADVLHARVLRASDLNQRAPILSKELLNFDNLANQIHRALSNLAANYAYSNLKRRLVNVSESNTLNTYFLPVNTDELEQVLSQLDGARLLDAMSAHIIPDQVLFTRQLGLGRPHQTLANNNNNNNNNPTKGANGQQVSLSLAKTLSTTGETTNTDGQQQQSSSLSSSSGDDEQSTRRLLASPLLLEAESSVPSESAYHGSLPAGLSSAEIVLANVPLDNGVLHLIKRPVALAETSLLDYINDNDKQLSNVVSSLGSRSGCSTLSSARALATNGANIEQPVQLNRFRELLARDRQLLATFSEHEQQQQHQHANNRTILAPSDQAFARLRYDLRALVSGDDSMIPSHWDSNYKADLLERLVKRHIIADQSLTSGQLRAMARGAMSVLSVKGQVIQFKEEPEIGTDNDGQAALVAECDSGTKARLIHRDFAASNGLMHILDHVLGEEQETLHTLLKALMLKSRVLASKQQIQDSNNLIGELAQMVESRKATLAATVANEQQQDSSGQQTTTTSSSLSSTNSDKLLSPELGIVSKTVGQFIDELSEQRRSLLATSVNISYQLAQLAWRAESKLDDWTEQFKSSTRMFTYFIPNDLAWLRLQQARPELHRPLVYLLEQAASVWPSELLLLADNIGQQQAGIVGPESRQPAPQPSESSHRLLQILERHLVANRKLSASELGRMTQLQTLGATLRLIDQPAGLVALSNGQQQAAGQQDGPGHSSAFAALHSIIGGHLSSSSSGAQQNNAERPVVAKALRLGSGAQANILQAHEASNAYVYLIDQVLVLPDDLEYLQMTSATPNSVGSTMSSLLGGHNSALLEIVQNFFGTGTTGQGSQLLASLIGTLSLAIVILVLIIATVLVRRRRRQNKLTRHQQLESGLTSCSSNSNSGSTSTNKSL